MSYTASRLRFLEDLGKRITIIEIQTETALQALKNNKLINRTLGKDMVEDTVPDALFSKITLHEATESGIWTTIGGLTGLGSRRPGEGYPQMSMITGYESVVKEGSQIAGEVEIPEEYENKTRNELKKYFDEITLQHQVIQYETMSRMFDVFDYAFDTPSTYPDYLFARGSVDGLNEPLVSTQHARKDGGPVIPNTFTGANNMRPLNDDNLWAAKVNVLGAMVSDIGQSVSRGWGELAVVAPTSNSALRTVFELGKSEFKIDTANNNINIHYLQGWRVIHSRLIDRVPSTSWFVVDLTSFVNPDYGNGLLVVEFLPIISRIMTPEYTRNDSYIYKIKYSFKAGWLEFRNIFGSKGDGSTYTL